MKLIRTSGIDSFISGVSEFDINNLPEEKDLNEDQKKHIRDLSLSDALYYKDKLKYFLRYPNIVHITIYSFDEYYEIYRDTELFVDALEKFYIKFNQEPNLFITMPSNIPLNFIKKFLNNEKFPIRVILDFLNRQLSYKKNSKHLMSIDILEYVQEIYPEEYNKIYLSGESIENLIVDFLHSPSKYTYDLLSYACEAMSKEEKKLKFIPIKKSLLANFEKRLYDKKIHGDHHKNNYTAMEIIEPIFNIKESIQENKDLYGIDSDPFSCFIQSIEGIGNIHVTYFEDYRIHPKVLDEIYDIIGRFPSDSKFYVHVEGSPLKLSIEDKNDNVIYQTNDLSFHDSGDFSSYRLKSPESAVFDRLRLNEIEESEIINEKLIYLLSKNDNYQSFLNFCQSDIFNEFISDINYIAWDKYINKYSEVPYGKTTKEVNEYLPYKLNVAFNIFKKLPENIISLIKYENAFTLCSGLFPAKMILDIVKGDLRWAKRLIGSINCSGGEEQNKNLMALINIEYSKKEASSRLSREEIKKFLDNNAKKTTLEDFPELKQYSLEFLNRNISSHSLIWDYSTGKDQPEIEMAIRSLLKIPIYLISGNKMVDHFTLDVLEDSDISPTLANGYYIDGSYIIVFTDNVSKDIDVVLGAILGIKDASEHPELGISQESTVWHEMAHALANRSVKRSDNNNINSMEEWMTSPDEILAIQYGNLAYIKNKLFNFFSEIFPFNEKIKRGFLNEIKSGIIDHFKMEFVGMTEEKAIDVINGAISEFDNEVLEIFDKMSREEKINHLVRIFTSFFMGQFLKSKVEEELKKIKKDKEIKIENPKSPPENYNVERPMKDAYIQKLEKNQEYINFIKKCRNAILNNQIPLYRIKRFVKNINYQNQLLTPMELENVCAMLFDSKGEVSREDFDQSGPFRHLASFDLINEIKNMVLEKKSRISTIEEPPPVPISPETAKETGEFMAEMEEEYGPDWIWLANSKKRKITANWYTNYRG